MKDFYFSDEYVEQMGDLIVEEAENIESTLKLYINLMQHISDEGIMEGETAEALKTFIEQAEELKGCYKDFALVVSTACTSFIHKVDEADDYLY
ncbi:MAG: hypothetical protein LUH09_05515 [Clostridiales bacterium]|nr:hypothetical protein [Clostridiales bacterium]